MIKEGMQVCYHCKNPLDLSKKVGRQDTCPKCGRDLHVCLNCKFYDPHFYNACQEPQAERILDKEKANFCEFFSFRSEVAEEQKSEKAKQLLEALFKKGDRK